jgi:hypothetical protein
MAEPLIRYNIAVTYVIGGDTKTYTGFFAGQGLTEAVDRARKFVTQYIRPSCIQSVVQVSAIVS